MAPCESFNKPILSSGVDQRPSEFQPRALRSLDGELKRLIPQRLLELSADPSKVEVLRICQQFGGFDGFRDGFEPSLGLLIVERGALKQPAPHQESSSSHWEHVLNYQRKVAIRQGLLTVRDKVLVAFVADDKWNQDGVEVLSLVITENLRGRGVGTDFYQKFEQILAKLGYKYLYGANSEDNIGFFQRMGRYSLGQLKPEKLNGRLMPPGVVSLGHVTIKFLDRAMEAAYVEPKFLRAG